MAKNKLVFKMDSLEKIEKSLAAAKKYRARVGIFGDKNVREGKSAGPDNLTNAEIGARMEFGFTIPDGPFKGVRVAARSFLRMPIRTHVGEIAKMMKAGAMTLLVQGKIDLLFARLGKAGRATVIQAFSTSGWGSWKENSPVTIILKESDKPLLDTNALRNSIESTVKK